MRAVLALLAWIAVSAAVAYARPQQGVDCTIAENAIDIASRIRGLTVRRAVPCKLQDRTEVEAYLRNALKKKIPEERVQREGEMYRLLGLIPREYDYLNGLIGLYTDQLGGYYEPEDEYYAMAAWIPELMQMPIAVHELTHALQDQHFDLDTAIDHKKQLSDSLMARSALIEGDATAVMLDYARELSGQPSIANETSVSAFMMQNITGAMISSSLHKAPPALQAMLIFPYVSGLNFAHAVLKQGGYRRIDQAFKRYPRSTEEILHPDKYLKGEPDFIELPEPAPPKELRGKAKQPVFSDRLGEFAIATLLGTWLPPAAASSAATGWGGDRATLYERPDQPPLAIWQLAWDTEEDAAELFEALSKAYEKRFEQQPRAEGQKRIFSATAFGPVVLRREGVRVTVRIGHEEP